MSSTILILGGIIIYLLEGDTDWANICLFLGVVGRVLYFAVSYLGAGDE